MASVFYRVVNMSLTASVVILAVLALRLLLRRAPKIFSYALWAVVLFRLLCPVSFSSPLSLFGAVSVPAVQSALVTPVSNGASGANSPAAGAAFPAGGSAQAVSGGTGSPSAAQTAQSPAQTPQPAGPWEKLATVLPDVWLAGAGAMLLYNFASLLHLRRKLVGAVKLSKNVYLADHIGTPFVFGLFPPRIYLPSALSEPERAAILLHEQTHIRRRDYIVKLLAFLALAVHWFNPLVWLGFSLMEKDMEMSCDEAVLRTMGAKVRREYSASLLRLATGRKTLASPIAFGEGTTKGRIRNVMNYKKPALWAVIAAFAVCAAGCVSLGANQTPAPAATFVPTTAPAAETQTASPSQSPDAAALDTEVGKAVLSYNAGNYADGEAAGEGHIVLGSETSGSTVTVYALTQFGEYQFQDGNFVKASGTGAIPAVLTFTVGADGSYALKDFQVPADGSGYEASVKKMFPADLQARCLSIGKSDADALKTQEQRYATAYLTSIGRSATIGEVADFAHPLLTDFGVPVSVSNSLLTNAALANYPQWIGSLERLESGVRYVYTVTYSAQNQTVTYAKTNYATKEVVESYVFNSATGDQVSTPGGSGTATALS